MQVNDENRSEPKEFKQKLYFHSKDRNQLYYIFLKKSPSKQASQVLLIGLEGGRAVSYTHLTLPTMAVV